MNNIYLGFKFAFSYFSIIPVKFNDNVDLSKKEILGNMVLFLPLVGFVLGLITVSIYLIFDSIPLIASILSASIYMVLYGFIHTEAIIDVVDAIYAKHSEKDPYEVIKEPTIGAMGLLYSVIFVILKIALLSYLLYNQFFIEFLVITLLSRFSVQVIIYISQFKSSFVTLLKDSFSKKDLFISLTFICLFIGFLLGFSYLLLIVFSLTFSYLVSVFIKKQIGFLNGDALGTILELNELFLALVVCYLWL